MGTTQLSDYEFQTKMTYNGLDSGARLIKNILQIVTSHLRQAERNDTLETTHICSVLSHLSGLSRLCRLASVPLTSAGILQRPVFQQETFREYCFQTAPRTLFICVIHLISNLILFCFPNGLNCLGLPWRRILYV